MATVRDGLELPVPKVGAVSVNVGTSRLFVQDSFIRKVVLSDRCIRRVSLEADTKI